MKDQKLDSLITLLDDPDNSVFQYVSEEILKRDISIVDHLEHICETSLDKLVQKRIQRIIQQIQFSDSRKKIKNWANQTEFDLFEGFFLISQYHYAELKLKKIQSQLEKIRKDVWLEFRNSLTSLEKVTILNHIFYDHYRFKVDRDHPDSPENCYLNNVLDLHQGNPISIAIVYTLVARSLDLPVHYIDFNQNPLVGYFDRSVARLAHGKKNGNPVLFYINPTNKGAIIGPKEIDYIQQTTEFVEKEKLTAPCPDRIILKRLVEKLALSYEQLGAYEKADSLNEIADIL